MILDFHALHVLSADIENKINIRAEFLGRCKVRYSLDYSEIKAKGIFNKLFAVSRRSR